MVKYCDVYYSENIQNSHDIIWNGDSSEPVVSSETGNMYMLDMIIFYTLLGSGMVHLYENVNYYTERFNNACNIAWAKFIGIRRYNRQGEEIFDELNEEYGSVIININEKHIEAEGYYNDDVIRGPGKVTISEDGKYVCSRGMYKNNLLNGPGTYEVEECSDKSGWSDGEWIKGTYTGTFRNNNLHGTGKFENEYICVSGEFKDGYIQSGLITIKEFNENYMSKEYWCMKSISGEFSGKDYLSNTAYVSFIPLNGNGMQEKFRFYDTVKQTGTFKNSKLNGRGKEVVISDKRQYEITGCFCMDNIMGEGTVKYNDIEIKTVWKNGDYKEITFIYPDGNQMTIDDLFENVSIKFKSGDVVTGKLSENSIDELDLVDLMYDNIPVNYDLENILTKLTNMKYTSCRTINDLDNLEFNYWLRSKCQDNYDYLYKNNMDKEINGEKFINFQTTDDFNLPNVSSNFLEKIMAFQKEPIEISENSDSESMVVV